MQVHATISGMAVDLKNMFSNELILQYEDHVYGYETDTASTASNGGLHFCNSLDESECFWVQDKKGLEIAK